MTDWRDSVEGLTLKGEIALPYTWWVGATGSRFLTALRDEKKIFGNRCPACKKVYVPPRMNCGRCFRDITEWVELGLEGEVSAYTIVRHPFKLHPAAPVFAYALVLLDGADVGFLHIIKERLELLKKGARVRARFRENRTGHIMDIDSFEIIS